jgi:hypothetical protein
VVGIALAILTSIVSPLPTPLGDIYHRKFEVHRSLCISTKMGIYLTLKRSIPRYKERMSEAAKEEGEWLIVERVWKG